VNRLTISLLSRLDNGIIVQVITGVYLHHFSADFVYQQSNRLDFAQLPFANGFGDAPIMDCNENTAPQSTTHHLSSALRNSQNPSGLTVTCDPTTEVEFMANDRGHLGEINQNRVEPFSCLKFRDPPVKCINFMSHYI
jgi:hypothetical protein